eukprot:11378643-Alexandrium_andersonii.AAC.1
MHTACPTLATLPHCVHLYLGQPFCNLVGRSGMTITALHPGHAHEYGALCRDPRGPDVVTTEPSSRHGGQRFKQIWAGARLKHPLTKSTFHPFGSCALMLTKSMEDLSASSWPTSGHDRQAVKNPSYPNSLRV